MFKNIFFLSITILIFACGQTADKATATANKIGETAKGQVTTATATKPATVTVNNTAVKDTLKPAENPNHRKRNYTISQARPKNKIVQEFPFDIPLKKADGTVLYSNDAMKKGKPTILLFWLTTCYPCRIEMDAIQKVYADWEKEEDFNLVAISTDFEKNHEKFGIRVKEKNFPWPSYIDKHREFRHVLPGGLNGLPQTFIFDKNGEIAYHSRKYRTGDEEKLFAKIKELNAM